MIASGKKIYLCRPDLQPITELNGICTETVEYNEHLKDFFSLSFEVDEYINVDGVQVKSNGYDLLDVYLNIYLEDIGYFQMQHPQIMNDGQKERKTILAYSIEKEFEDTDYVGFRINTGATDSLEQLAADNVNELGFAKEFVKFYDPKRKDLSLLHLLLDKMPGWSVVDSDIDPLLWNVKLSIDEDNINLYALLNSVIAPKAECIFLFDILHRKVKAVSKYSLEYETNIFIGFRNLARAIEINVDEDSVYTRLNCEGDDDLSFKEINYGDSRIFDLSYFLREPYMSTEQISKISDWVKWREDHRDEYIGYAKSHAELTDKISEIKLRVPNDGDDWKQWDEMEEDLLQKNLSYYNALLSSLQVSVDANPQYDTEGNYIPWKKSDGTIEHDKYLKLLYDMANGYGGYYTYIEIRKYIIPNIEIAISNLNVPKDDKTEYIKDFETNWDLYGITELEAKKKDYENRLDSLKQFSKAWSELTDEEKAKYAGGEEAYNVAGRNKYVEYQTALGSETTQDTLLYKLKQLKDEVQALQLQLDKAQESINTLTSQADMLHSTHGFTDEDIKLINALFHDTDYQNTNIVSTSVDNTFTKLDREKELYEDSISKLSELSHPQFTFTTEMDNLLALDEFKDWHDDFVLLRYIRLGVRDDYSVKLRLIGRSWNPCINDPELSVEFSSMITSRSGRSDLTDILESANNRGSKNSISIGTGNSDSDKEYMTNLLQMMISNNLFKNAVTNISGSTTSPIDSAQINILIGDYLKYATIDVGKITGNEADFLKLFAEYIDADYINSRVIISENGEFKNLTTEVATIKQAMIGTAGADTGIFINLNANNTKIDQAFIKTGIAANMSIADLKVGDITISDSMRIISENGGLVMNGTALQIYGTTESGDKYVGIQLGYDTNNTPSLILRNANGAIMLDPNGLHDDIVPDNFIKTNMIGNGQISKDKLSFNIEVDENGDVITNIDKIYDENGNKWGAQYNQFKETVTSNFGELDQKIEDSIAYRLDGYSSNGTIFKLVVDTTLSVIAYHGKEDVTAKLPESCFVWTRKSSNAEDDEYWNSQHGNGQKFLHVTDEQLYNGEGYFTCGLWIDGTEVATTSIFK